MPIEDPDDVRKRNERVAAWNTVQHQLKAEAAKLLEAAQKSVLDYLTLTDEKKKPVNNPDGTIRKVLNSYGGRYQATKTSLRVEQASDIPLDGRIIEGFNPAFMIDHQGKSSRRYSIPGCVYTYSFKGERSVEISLTYCVDESGIFPVVHVLCRDGRSHDPTRQDIYADTVGLENWLKEIIENPWNLKKLYMAQDSQTPASDGLSDQFTFIAGGYDLE